jgi:tRNA modification GTPase
VTVPNLTTETYVACLTPPGAAAIATLAVRGPQAWEVVRSLFRPRSGPPPMELAPERFAVGWLGQELADEVVVAIKRREPVPWVEIHCHGGPQVIRLLIEQLQAHGVRECSRRELEAGSTPDPLQAAAAVALTQAWTTRTAAILLDQYNGAFRRAVEAVRAALERGDRAESDRLLAELARYADVGRHLTEPWRVVVAGAPNVGKSSLVNALAGFARCVVSSSPGTTRDVVTTLIAVDGWPVELADTAGLREGTGELEAQGIDLARQAVAEADLCLWVLDASTEPIFPGVASGRVHLVVNKTDLAAAWDLDQAAGAVHVSARTDAGLTELCQALAGWLVPDPPSAGAAVCFTAALCRRVEDARQLSRAGRINEAWCALEDQALQRS